MISNNPLAIEGSTNIEIIRGSAVEKGFIFDVGGVISKCELIAPSLNLRQTLTKNGDEFIFKLDEAQTRLLRGRLTVYSIIVTFNDGQVRVVLQNEQILVIDLGDMDE